MNFFIYDNADNALRIEEHDILLVKEFKDLWDIERNKCKEDKTGKNRLRAYRELTYIYLMLDFKSPYFEYVEQDKHEAAQIDSGISNVELTDEKFKAAYRKYDEIQQADPILSLIKTAYKTLYRTQVFLDSIDFTEVDSEGRPLYKPKDVVADIGSIAKMRNQLLELEVEHKKGLAASGNKVRGGNEVGFRDV